MQSRIYSRMLLQRRMSWFCWAEIWIWWSRHVTPWNGVLLNTVLTSATNKIRLRGWRTDTQWSIISFRKGESWCYPDIHSLPWTYLISDGKYSFVLFTRIALMKEAANKNQDFQNALQSLDFFLMNLPNNTIKPADNTAQITAKRNSQEVCRKTIILIVFSH